MSKANYIDAAACGPQISHIAVLIFVCCATTTNAEPFDRFQDCNLCPEMIELPTGSFVMGAPVNEFRRMLVLTQESYSGDPENPYLKTDEGPQQLVEIDVPIAIGVNEITYNEWMACVDDGGCDGYTPRSQLVVDGAFVEFQGDYPVFNVSIDDANSYIDWLNETVGEDVYRLPTEAEWEYAARAGTSTRFAQGDSLSAEQANFSRDGTQMMMLTELPKLAERQAVVQVHDLDAANAWGIRHMSGNVFEYTSSCYSKTLTTFQRSSEWINAARQPCDRYSKRGGAFLSSMDLLRVAWRGPVKPNARRPFNGFWSCHGYVPVSQLIYAAFRSNAKGLFPPSDE